MSDALHLPRTAGRILDALAQTRRTLRVDEIVARARSSERSVRENLSLLVRRGILEREVFVTTNKKLAYAYSLKPVEDLLTAVRRDLSLSLRKIESVARRLFPATPG